MSLVDTCEECIYILLLAFRSSQAFSEACQVSLWLLSLDIRAWSERKIIFKIYIYFNYGVILLIFDFNIACCIFFLVK